MAIANRAVVVGAGPNGLAAAVLLARAGVPVTVFEAHERVGGGSRTAELTLPGFRHDVCAAIHPLGAGSPFFRRLPLERYGLHWIQPELQLAHPFDDGSATVLRRSIEETCAGLGADGEAYRDLIGPLAKDWDRLAPAVLGPLLRAPQHPLALARFGFAALRSASGLARARFRRPQTQALFAGLAAHGNVPLDARFSGALGLVLSAAAHAAGWPVAAGGSQAVSDALARYLQELGGEVRTDERIESLESLRAFDAALFDVTPRQLLQIAGGRLSERCRRSLRRFRYGPGVFKIDYALSGPAPWTAAECRRAGTVHLGGTIEEIEASEAQVSRGQHPERPYVIVAQQSLFDATRAPAGQHTLWAYCHVPSGSTVDMSARVEAQIERFAPGFRALVLARRATSASELEAYNPNYIGGDIAGGANDGWQLLVRPALRFSPYRTSDPRIFLCSASTPPGAGVHGMCGYFAAKAALGRLGA